MNTSNDGMLAQIEALRSDLYGAKKKALLQLLVSSFATLIFTALSVWFSIEGGRSIKTSIAVPVLLLCLPALINMFGWVMWTLLSVTARIQSSYARMVGPGADDYKEFYREFERLSMELFRSRRIEQLIDVLTASTFISISASLTLLLWSLGRFS